MLWQKGCREQTLRNLLDFVEQNPDEPLLAEYPYPAKEFIVQIRGGSIAIFHSSLPAMFLD